MSSFISNNGYMEEKKKVKSNPITTRQKEMLVEFISAQKEMYTGKLTTMYTREKMFKNWQELTNILNSVPDGPAKDWKQWRKSWVDIKKNTKSRHSNQKNIWLVLGGGPPPYPPPDDLPGIEEKVLNIITPVAISGNKNILETKAVFNFESDDIFGETYVNLDINHKPNSTDYILEESIPELESITSYASEFANTSTPVKSNNAHDYCLTENSKPQSPSRKLEVDMEKTKTSKVSFSHPKRRTKVARLDYSLRNNDDKLLKLTEESNNSEKEYKQRKLLLLENDSLQKSRYYERKALALETIANAHKQIAKDIQVIKKEMIQNQKH